MISDHMWPAILPTIVSLSIKLPLKSLIVPNNKLTCSINTYPLMDAVEKAKKLAAFQAIDQHVKNGQIIGIGSGSTIVYAVERLKQKVDAENLSVICVPTSFQAKQLIRTHNLPLSDLEANPTLDIAFDGADEVDVSNKVLIKGGGGCLTQEKIVAFSSVGKCVIIVDERKYSTKLGSRWKGGVPIEVIPMAYNVVTRHIQQKLGGTVCLRTCGSGKAGPVVTDNSNFIVDWMFDPDSKLNWPKIDQEMHAIPGVVETGIFIGLANSVFIGNSDGSVKVIEQF